MIVITSIFIIFKGISKDAITTTKFEEIQNHNSESIKLDYDNKKIEAKQVATQENGINRYYNILINQLREYNTNDTNNIDNAKAIYELSDKLLNNMYQDFKNNMDGDSFNKLREEQRSLVDNKVATEKNLQDDEITKYKILTKITLDRCSEWAN